ncbi:MAG: winged helix-turn-helix domain-containing protein [Nitrososphaeria archaeon]
MPQQREYRERIYIRAEIIIKLAEHGPLTLTNLISYCGLNLSKHKEILDEMESKGLIEKFHEIQGKKDILKYKVTQKGLKFYEIILKPYIEMFPYKK